MHWRLPHLRREAADAAAALCDDADEARGAWPFCPLKTAAEVALKFGPIAETSGGVEVPDAETLSRGDNTHTRVLIEGRNNNRRSETKGEICVAETMEPHICP